MHGNKLSAKEQVQFMGIGGCLFAVSRPDSPESNLPA